MKCNEMKWNLDGLKISLKADGDGKLKNKILYSNLSSIVNVRFRTTFFRNLIDLQQIQQDILPTLQTYIIN